MTRPAARAGRLVVGAALVGVLTGCGAGGFGADPPPTPDRTVHSYVALGDGFVAAPYTGRTAGQDGCLRSTVNYPALVAQELGIEHVRDVSCTGASTSALSNGYKPAKGSPALPPQFDALDRDTDLVTVTVGLEDDDLLRDMFLVCVTQPCRPGQVGAGEVVDELTRASRALTRAILEIPAKAPRAYVVVVGYPTFTPASGRGCNDYPAQPSADADAIRTVVDAVNSKLQSAARQIGAGYVDVAALSADHPLCSAEPWVHDLHDKPGKAVAYHPVAAEQRAVAEQIATQVAQR